MIGITITATVPEGEVMHERIDQLLEAAKKLSPEERISLIAALYDLNAPVDPAWEAAWTRECEDRAVAIDRGEMKVHDLDEVMAEASSRISSS